MGHSMKDEADLWRSYFYEDAPEVLRNKYGLKNRSELNIRERNASDRRTEQLKLVHLPGNYDFKHLLRFHEKLFRDTYEWAGQPRTVDMSKAFQNFTLVSKMGLVAADIDRHVEHEKFFRGQDKEKFVGSFTLLFNRLNRLHPFREGNGRATQAFLRQLAFYAGYELDFKKVSKEGINTAAESAFKGDNNGLRFIFQNISEPRRAIAFELKPQQMAVAEFPELLGAYKALHAAKTSAVSFGSEFSRIAEELKAGRLPGNELVTVEESRIAAGWAAAYRGQTVFDAPPQDAHIRKGEVVAVTAHHVLVETQPGVALCYLRDSLAQQVFQAEHVEISPCRPGVGEKHPVTLKEHPGESLKPRFRRAGGMPIPAGVPVNVAYQGMLQQYKTSKYAQAQKVEERLEKQAEASSKALKEANANPPKFYALPSKRKAWKKTVDTSTKRLNAAENRLKKVREIMDSPMKIGMLAESKLRNENPALAGKHDITQNIARVQQLCAPEPEQTQTRAKGYGR
jgi:cell filamentation protein